MTELREIQRRVGVQADGVLGPATLAAIAKALGMDKPHALVDAGAFFKGVRAVSGQLAQPQVDTINALLTKASHWRLSWLAYGLATAWHEARLVPVEEIGKGGGRPYAKPGKYGQAQYGRGLVQLTWDKNYERADEELGLDGALLRDFSVALRPDIAADILVRGMEEGWFTGKKLADYLPGDTATGAQFSEARRIINGTDRADMIAGYALQFQAALSAGSWT
ncbi:hypothetical protein [Sphingomonas sp.]|uniref:hypothetical protein n=1 Tax=Sphingomonas sp. TaxID=28214 RepID=UPI002FD998FD